MSTNNKIQYTKWIKIFKMWYSEEMLFNLPIETLQDFVAKGFLIYISKKEAARTSPDAKPKFACSSPLIDCDKCTRCNGKRLHLINSYKIKLNDVKLDFDRDVIKTYSKELIVNLIYLFYDMNSILFIDDLCRKYINLGLWSKIVKPMFSNKTNRLVLIADPTDGGWFIDPTDGNIISCSKLGSVNCKRGDNCEYITCSFRHDSFIPCCHGAKESCKILNCKCVHLININIPDNKYYSYIQKKYPKKSENIYNPYELFIPIKDEPIQPPNEINDIIELSSDIIHSDYSQESDEDTEDIKNEIVDSDKYIYL